MAKKSKIIIPKIITAEDLLSERMISFMETLQLQSGSYVGLPFKLRGWQKDMIGEVYPPSRIVRTAVFTLPRKNGKCLSLDTKIPSKWGLKRLGEVIKGDILFGPDGRECKVTEVSDIKIGLSCYKITLQDGQSFITDGEHRWVVKSSNGEIIRTTTLKLYRNYHSGVKGYSIPISAGVDYMEKDLPIPPYLMGLWLGHRDDKELEVGNRVSMLIWDFCKEKKIYIFPESKYFTVSLFDKYRKCLPEDYLIGSIEQRLQLLCGIIEAVGTITAQGFVELQITGYVEKLLRLIRSLGVKCQRVMDTEKIFFIYDELNMPPLKEMRTEGVRDRIDSLRGYWNQIVSIKTVKSEPVKCIEVDSPYHCFVVGEGHSVTHNTELCGGIGLSHLVVRGLARKNQQIIIIASDREQGSILFDVVKNLILSDPELPMYFRIIDSKKKIIHLPTNGQIKVVPAVDFSLHGLNPSLVLSDEPGNWPAESGRKIFNVLRTSFGAQKHPLHWLLSTQAPNDTHFFSELIDYARDVQKGLVVDLTIKLFQWSAEEGEDVFDPAIWYKVNPALGDFRSITDLEILADQAKKMPSALNTFKNLFLNMRVDAHTPFISREAWVKNIDKTVNVKDLYGKVAFVGIDLSGGRDLTAVIVAIPREELIDGKPFFDVLSYFWKPEGTFEEDSLRDRVDYKLWANQGYLIALPGKMIDYGFIAQKLAELAQQFKVVCVGADRWRLNELSKELERIGLELEVIPIGMGFRDQSICVDLMEGALVEERVNHFNHPILTWCAKNAVVEKDAAGNRKLSKNSYGKIDGLVATGISFKVFEMKKDSTNFAYKSGESIYKDNDFYEKLLNGQL